jgi:hypothetical protein
VVSEAAFRAAALAMPEAIEVPHFESPSFRVNGKIFAQINPGKQRGILKLPKPRQTLLFEVRPEAFSPCVWGKLVWADVDLDRIEPGELPSLMADAWGGVAPKGLPRP